MTFDPASGEHQLCLWPADEAEQRRVGEPTIISRLLVTDGLRAMWPGGEHRALTKVFKKVVSSAVPKRRKRQLRWLRRFLAFKFLPGENWNALLDEDDETAILRIEEALVAEGLDVRSDNNDLVLGTRWVLPTEKSLSINYLAEYVHLIRRLYRELSRSKLRGPMSAADVDGWHNMSSYKRQKLATQMFPDNKWAWRNAGGRFVVRKRRPSPPALEDPTGCAADMHEALEAANVPQEVLDINLIARVNGNRVMEGAELNGLGLAMRGFDFETAMARNKASGPDPVKRLTIPSAVGGRIEGRLIAAPHPTEPGRTLLDYLRERWLAGDKEALKTVPLIPSPRTGKAYGYTGLHYYLQDAWEGKVLVHSEEGFRSATSQWNRHAAILSDVLDVFASETDDDRIAERMLEVSNTYHQKSDQTKRYAAVAYKWRYEGMRVRNIRRREQEAADRAAGRAGRTRTHHAPPEAPPFADAAAEAMWQALP
jgi:hypothetical protein